MSTYETSMNSMETTGRYLVLLPQEDIDSGIRAITDATGMNNVARAADFESHALNAEQLESSTVALFDRLGVAVVELDPDRAQSIRSAAVTNESLIAIEPERVVYALETASTIGLSPDYLQGYRDAIDHLVERTNHTESKLGNGAVADGTATWGLQATGVTRSPYSGLGIKVAVLDTGLDLTHPDFQGRQISAKSFIDKEDVQDRNGHGTHCIGTACGPKEPAIPPRYGIAYNAEIFAGKVLSNRGSGSDGGILAGIEWAISSGCKVISMSLGAPTFPGQAYSQIFERVGRRALATGTLIVCAVGSESRRRNDILNPVGHPAKCPSLMAVAAIDEYGQIADFSNRGSNPDGGQIDVAGPGVQVYSTWCMPTRYLTISGSSMATPHVAGMAALYAEATGETGNCLWGLLVQNARRLLLPSLDVGAGLVQAPMGWTQSKK